MACLAGLLNALATQSLSPPFRLQLHYAARDLEMIQGLVHNGRRVAVVGRYAGGSVRRPAEPEDTRQ